MLLQIFEEEKVHHILTIGEYPFYLLPLDEDVLSFELDLAYKVYKISILDMFHHFRSQNTFHVLLWILQECYVDGDTSSVWHIAKAIHKLEVCCCRTLKICMDAFAVYRICYLLNVVCFTFVLASQKFMFILLGLFRSISFATCLEQLVRKNDMLPLFFFFKCPKLSSGFDIQIS